MIDRRISSHFLSSVRINMAPKGSTVEELTATEQKAVFTALLPFFRNGGLMKGSFVTVGEALDVAPRTCARVWYRVLDNIENSPSEKIGAGELTVDESCDIMLQFMSGHTPLRFIPDECCNSGKVGACGQKKLDRQGLADRVVDIPLNDRSTFDGLANGLDISVGLAFTLLKEEGSLF